MVLMVYSVRLGRPLNSAVQMTVIFAHNGAKDNASSSKTLPSSLHGRHGQNSYLHVVGLPFVDSAEPSHVAQCFSKLQNP